MGGASRVRPRGGQTQHGTGDSPLQAYGASEPVPGDGRLPRHVGILQQEEMLERPQQCLQPCIAQHRPASPQHHPSIIQYCPNQEHRQISPS